MMNAEQPVLPNVPLIKPSSKLKNGILTNTLDTLTDSFGISGNIAMVTEVVYKRTMGPILVFKKNNKNKNVLSPKNKDHVLQLWVVNKNLSAQLKTQIRTIILLGRDPLTMGYLDNLDNGSPNKYEKNLKNRNNHIYMFFYL
jgi:hypothetical protein